MAEKSISSDELNKMLKRQLIELAQSFHLKTKGLSKEALIQSIIGTQAPLSDSEIKELSPDAESQQTEMESPKFKQPTDNWQFQLEMEKLQYQRERDKRHDDLERERERMRHEEEMARINASMQQTGKPTDGEKPFKVDVASKMLPKFGADYEIETYLVTFEKIATINKRPLEFWSAVLETQLKGKTLRVFSELSNADCKDYAKLKRHYLQHLS
jgi:hypothetical protein